MNNQPYDFEEAKGAATRATANQKAAEDFIRQAYREFAFKEERYRIALAQKITELHADGVAWSSTGDLARGDRTVARFKCERDIAEGVKEAAAQGGWKASKDRDDVHALIEWSMRRDLAEGRS